MPSPAIYSVRRWLPHRAELSAVATFAEGADAYGTTFLVDPDDSLVCAE